MSTNMYSKIFNELSKNNAIIAGGKGASLGEMTNAGIPVPEGFVILSNAFEHFVQVNELIVEIDSVLHSVNTEEVHTVENASEEIQALILNASITKEIEKEIFSQFKTLNTPFVAVRSSATAEDSSSAAWAGQLESYLNTTNDNLLENVKKCWASLFTPRAIFYRFEKNLHSQSISVAVVVQKMIQSEKSGIAFSVHPVTQDRNQLIIEAGFGLGEAIVSGQITPDSYVVEKDSLQIIEKTIHTQERGLFRKESGGPPSRKASAWQANEWREIPKKQREKQVLTNNEILKLSELILKIENYYGFPVDVEFACQKGKFYIVQSRPITTLQTQTKTEDSVYEAVFTLPYSNIFITDYFVPAYKEFEPVVTIEDGVWSFWLSKKVLRDLSEIGYKRAFQAGVVTKIKKDYKKFSDEIQCLKKSDLAKLLTDEFIAFLEGLKEFVGRFYLTYREMEFFYFSRVEEELIEGLPERTKIEEVLTDNRTAISLPRKKRELARYLIQIQHLKFEYRKLINKLAIDNDSLLSKVFEQLIVRTGRKDVTSLTVLEIKRVLGGGSIRDLSVRHQASFVTFDRQGNKLIIENGFLAIKKIKKFKEKFFRMTEEQVRGQSACSGEVRGRVRVIPFTLNITGDSLRFDFQKGEVLVSTTTGPEMVSIMKRAAAIITDEGGLMSHAAIVAREFRIPCIVGTKIATKVLKDRDLVEVDADTGVVKILERAG